MELNKNLNNTQIVNLLRAGAAAYKIKDANKFKFKIIAYEKAADAVEHLSSEAKDLHDDGQLEGVSGIGPSIAKHLAEIFATGKSTHFDELFNGIPLAVFELIKIGGVGPKTAYKIASTYESDFKKAKTDTEVFRILKALAQKGEIAKLEGMGEDSQSAILKSLNELEGREVRLLLPYAQKIADELIQWLTKDENVVRADALGSLRRKVSTIGDVDLAAATKHPHKTIEHFCAYPNAARVLEKGERTAAIIVPGDKQVDLLVETPDAYGAVLQHFTGSKHHNIALRKLALKKGLSLSDYGIAKASENSEASPRDKEYKKFSNEEDFYKFIGLEWIPPELREDRGEIHASLTRKLPKLVDLSDIKSDLQIHSSFDTETSHDLGESSMQEIIDKANELGYEFLAFTEHNPSKSKHTQQQIVDLLKRKKEKVDKINESLSVNSEKREKRVKKVFNSLEIDILPDGSLPVSEAGLMTLDFALVSIHSSFRQDKSTMTDRVLRALDNPKIKIFAHPTGRKLNEREGVDLDWEKVFEFCIVKDIWIEINCDPMRLDLPDHLVFDAIKRGIKLTLGTDSHHESHMDNMPYGVWVARRGWATADDIINS